jgi:chromosome segregation ATPase
MPQTTALEEKLEQLKKDLETCDKQIESLKNNKENYQKDIDFLDKVDKEIDQVSASYAKALDQIKKDKENIDTYYEDKKRMIEGGLDQAKKNEINEIIIETEHAISLTRSEAVTLREAFAGLENEYEEEKKKKEPEKKQKEYEDLKNLKTGINSKLKRLKNLQSEIEKIEEENKPGKMQFMYFLILEMEKIKNQLPEIDAFKTEAQFKKELTDAWQAIDTANTDLRNKEQPMNEKKSQLEEIEKELDKLEESRIEDIKEKIKEKN